MHISDYTKGDYNAILDLFRDVYGKEMSLSYWQWRFHDNPAGKHMIKLMWDHDKLVGHYAVSPVLLNINGADHLSALSMTTMTHPEYGGKGIFPQLANCLYDDIENKINVKAVWGFPNRNSHYSFIKKLNWLDLATIPHLSLVPGHTAGSLHPNIRVFKEFNEQHEKILYNVASGFSVKVLRSKEYLNWRYVDNPTSTYDKFEWFDGNVNAFIVVKKYPVTANDEPFELFITELGISHENISLLTEFLNHIASHYGKNTKSINTWMNIFDPRHIHLEKIGFQLGGIPTIFGVRPADGMKDGLNDYKNWYISYGDSDVY